MKIQVEFDITPQEARKMLGLPDVEALQEKIIDLLYEEMKKGIEDIKDPDKLFQRFMPMSAQGMEQLQKIIPNISKWSVSEKDRKQD